MLVTLPAEIETVRIPELARTDRMVANEDLFIMWIAELNQTVAVPASVARLMLKPSGEPDTYLPIQEGASFFYVVPPEKQGDDTVDIPQIAGMHFRLVRDMMPLIPGTDYMALSSGGFKLIDDELIAGQRYEITPWEFIGGMGGSASGSGSGYVSGKKLTNTNLYIAAADVNKRHAVRGGEGPGAAQLELTLPDYTTVRADGVFFFETYYGNKLQHKIKTSFGQKIYYNGTQAEHFWIGRGEFYALLVGDDGYYMIQGQDNQKMIGQPQLKYAEELNEIVGFNQRVLKTEYPRLYETAKTFGGAFTSLTNKQMVSIVVAGRTVPNPYRGCFADDTDALYFWLPDLRNVVFRSLNWAVVDNQRAAQHSGVLQWHEVFAHAHEIQPPTSATSTTDAGQGRYVGGGDGNEPTQMVPFDSDSYGGTETRMTNIGFKGVIKF